MFPYTKKIATLLQTSVTVRYVCVLLFFFIAFGIVAVTSYFKTGTPIIESIEPSIGSSNDVLIIRGQNFGVQEINTYVDIAGIKPTISSYLEWSENLIMVRLPEHTETGLVYVHVGNRQSNPKLFADRMSIPVVAPQADPSKSPYITSIQVKQGVVGDLICISGRNFGTTREDSKVEFPWIGAPIGQNRTTPQMMISASETDFDYENWSDQEIKVRIPTGATTGNIQIVTKKNKSNAAYLEIETVLSCPESRKYAVTIEAEISNIVATGDNVMYLRIPRPLNTPFQIMSETGTQNVAPLIANHQDKIIHRIDNVMEGQRYIFSHSFVIDSYAVSSNISEQNIKPYKNTRSPLYIDAISETKLLPIHQEYIVDLLKKINTTNRNPYICAKQIYRYLLTNFEIDNDGKDVGIERTVKRKKGTGCDITLLYTALLRSAKIPARPCAGFFIDNQRQAQPHWWTEIYFERIGWIPVDIRIAMSPDFVLLTEPENRADFYFGNCDAQHVIFSRGETTQKAMAIDSKTVSYPTSYAFQNIWEEYAGDISMYTSFWRGLSVTGIY